MRNSTGWYPPPRESQSACWSARVAARARRCQPAPVTRARRSLHARRALRSWAIALAALGLGCGGDAAPPPPDRDGGGARDAGVPVDARPEDASPRREEPSLPPADVELVLPYFGPEETLERTVRAQPGLMDVHFSVDTTGSFGEEIDALQSDLTGRIVPRVEERVRDVAFGVSRFEDFPIEPYGASTDVPFALLTPITPERGPVRAGVARLDDPFGNGGDTPESGYEALYQIASGEGLDPWIEPYEGDGAGGVGFREGALHVVVHVTDAPSHDTRSYAPAVAGAHGPSDALAALRAIDARVLGIASSVDARRQLEDLALGTGATAPPNRDGLCETGLDEGVYPARDGACPLVFDVGSDGRGLSDAIVDAIVGLLDVVEYGEVYGRAADDRLGFVQAIEAAEATPPDGLSEPTRADLRPPDGVDDTFQDVRAGTELRFRVRLRNETIPPATYDQVFRITLEIVGDGLVLDRLTVRIVVPFGRLDAGTPDAGTPDGGQSDAGVPGSDAGTSDGSDAGTPDGSDAGAPDAGAATDDGGAADTGTDAG